MEIELDEVDYVTVIIQVNELTVAEENKTVNFSLNKDNELVDKIHTFLLPTFAGYAVVSNFLVCAASATLVKRSLFPHLYIYLTILGIFNILVVITQQQTISWLMMRIGRDVNRDVRDLSDVTCVGAMFIEYFIKHMNRWLFVFVVAYFCVINCQDKERSMPRLVDVIAAVTALSATFNCHYFWTYGLDKVTLAHGSRTLVCKMRLRNVGGIELSSESYMFLSRTIWTVTELLPFATTIILLICRAIMNKYRCASRSVLQTNNDGLENSVLRVYVAESDRFLNRVPSFLYDENQPRCCEGPSPSNKGQYHYGQGQSDFHSGYNSRPLDRILPRIRQADDKNCNRRVVHRLAIGYLLFHGISMIAYLLPQPPMDDSSTLLELWQCVTVIANVYSPIFYVGLWFPLIVRTDIAFRSHILRYMHLN